MHARNPVPRSSARTSTGRSCPRRDRRIESSTGLVALAAAWLAACSGGGGDADGVGGTPGGLIVNQTGLAGSANAVVASTAPGRSDPEGVAPPAPEVVRLTWRDARNNPRTLTLYAHLYRYDFSFAGAAADPNQLTQRVANDDAFGHEGFGYVVSHNTQNGNSPLGKANAPSRVQTTLFAGAHHAIHRVELPYDRDKEAGGNGIRIPVVIEWLVATGRDHPVWAVTYRMGEVQNPGGVDLDVYRMDVRGPYGSLNFDGAANRSSGDVIGGVSWGDHALRFRSVGVALSLDAPWTYDTPNSVNFTQAWTANVNAEMGIVQTRSGDRTLGYPDRVVGRERGRTSAAVFADKGDCTGFDDTRVYTMPCVNGWPYQLMNFDWSPGTAKPLGEATGTKLMAWGAPYGWLGASAYSLFDFSADVDGRGDRAYSTFIVLGPKCRLDGAALCVLAGDVDTTLAAVEALSAAAITDVSVGTLTAQVPRGPGATAPKSLVNGYDDTYATFHLDAAANQVDFRFVPAAGRPVSRPVFVIGGFTARQLPAVSVDGVPLSVNDGRIDAGAFVSIDTARNELWVTLNRSIGAASQIRIGP